jgi:hypothetical protein
MVTGCVVWGLFHGRGRSFCSSEHTGRLWAPEYWSSSSWGKVEYLHLVQRLRMNRAVHMPALYAFQACTGTFAFAEVSYIRIVTWEYFTSVVS